MSDDQHPGDGPVRDPWELPVPSLEPYPGQEPPTVEPTDPGTTVGAPVGESGTDTDPTAPVPVVPPDLEAPQVDVLSEGADDAVAAEAAEAADLPAQDDLTLAEEAAGTAAVPVVGGRAARRRAAEADAEDDEDEDEDEDEGDDGDPGDAVGGIPVDWSEAQGAGGRAARRRAAEEASREQSHRAHGRLVVLGVAAVVVLALAGLAYTWLSRQAPAPEPQPTASPTSTAPTQPTLLLQVVDDEGVAVSNALLSVGGPLGRANVISIPQNTLMDVATGGTLPYGQINRLPDPNGSAGALSDAIGVDVNGALALDPGALSGLVDAVGGITADVDVDVTEERADGTTLIIVPAGPGQVLQGNEAEAFATFLEEGETEEARMARFVQVLRLTVAKLPADVTKIETILTQLGASARATVPFSELADFFLRLNADVNADDVAYKNLPVQGIDTGGPAAYRVDTEAAAELVNDLLPEALRKPGPNSKVRVLVQNGVGSPGLNAAARTLLVEAGFTFVNGGNAAAFGQARTNVILPDTSKESLAWGADIVTALDLPDSAVRVAEDGQSVADVIVVLGEDFTPTAP
ncbi:LCP family protein [Longivirga aurantiaca]|uniref:LCP family protein n=1 Tax=Longivirga aurantiaca TaxID=1837743 RepID=A0ABW1T459_9ACTN